MRTATKDKIHSAAVRLFTQKGLGATSVQDIAKSAGISAGLLYRHYKSKEDLFSALVAQAADEMDGLIRWLHTDAQPLDIMGGLTLQILDDIDKGGQIAQLLMLINQSLIQQDEHPQEALLRETTRLIKKGQALGQFRRGSATEMAVYYFAAMGGLAQMKLTLKERFAAPSLDIVMAFLINSEQ
jgi:AcrR family transcriptional regulator